MTPPPVENPDKGAQSAKLKHALGHSEAALQAAGVPPSSETALERAHHRKDPKTQGNFSMSLFSGTYTLEDAEGNKVTGSVKGGSPVVVDKFGREQCRPNFQDGNIPASGHLMREGMDLASRMGSIFAEGSLLEKVGFSASMLTTGFDVDVHPGDIPRMCNPVAPADLEKPRGPKR